MLFNTDKKAPIIHEFPENIDYNQVLNECNEIIDKYNPNFSDPFKKNLKIYNQAKLIKVLIENYDWN
jgi:hypothetical protein